MTRRRPKSDKITIWRYDSYSWSQNWRKSPGHRPRLLDSVILDPAKKKLLLEDMTWFLKADTAAFYENHGIPYHRAYLFYGPPGYGKTSATYALAGHFKRNLCFFPIEGATESTLQHAFSTLPNQSMVVLEDVDALYTADRKVEGDVELSFSAFLNAIDGIGAPQGVIFIFTTNYPEKLDPAMKRPGRVDIQVPFETSSANVQQMMVEYFALFYPGCAAQAKAFSVATSGRMTNGTLSMAKLQHFFLDCHRKGLDAAGAANLVTTYSFDTKVELCDNNSKTPP